MPLHLFHGGEPFLVERAFEDAWRKLVGAEDFSLDAELLDPGSSAQDVLAAAGAIGFFNTGRVIGIRDWRLLAPKPGRRAKPQKGDPLEQAAELLAQVPAASHVVISVYSTVAATNPVLALARRDGEAAEFPRLRPGDVHGWLARRLREIGVSMESAAQRVLVESAGEDLRVLDSELLKLATYAEGRAITTRDVRALVPDTADHQVWALTDSLLGDPGRAMVELERALASESAPGYLSYMLVRQLRILLAAGSAPAGAAGSAALTAALASDGRPVSEYTVKKAVEQARRVDRSRVETLYRRAARFEAASRRGEMEDVAALQLLVMGAAG